MILHKPLWHVHPDVRSGSDLSLGERAADRVKRVLGSWAFIWGQTGVVVVWVALNLVAVALRWDPYPFILLNLAFSTQAAYAAPILQLSNNRSDRQASELALSTHANGEQLLAMNKQQLEILSKLDQILAAQPSPLQVGTAPITDAELDELKAKFLAAQHTRVTQIAQTPLTNEQLAAQVQAAAEQHKPGGAT